MEFINLRSEQIKALIAEVENLSGTLASFKELDEIKPQTACHSTQTSPSPSCKETSTQTDPTKPATPATTKRKQPEAPYPPAKRTNLNGPAKPAPSRVPKPAAAQVVLHGEKSAAHTVVISDDPQADPRAMLKAVRAAHTLPQGVWASLRTKGKLVLHSSNPDTIPAVTTSLANKLDGMKVRQQKVILPRICLFKVDEETSNSTIEETLLETPAVSQLPGDKVVRVAHRSAPRNGTCTAFIEVDLTTFRALGNRGRIVVDGVILNFEESIRARAEIAIFEQYLVKIDLLKEDVESQLLTGDLYVLNQTKENLHTLKLNLDSQVLKLAKYKSLDIQDKFKITYNAVKIIDGMLVSNNRLIDGIKQKPLQSPAGKDAQAKTSSMPPRASSASLNSETDYQKVFKLQKTSTSLSKSPEESMKNEVKDSETAVDSYVGVKEAEAKGKAKEAEAKPDKVNSKDGDKGDEVKKSDAEAKDDEDNTSRELEEEQDTVIQYKQKWLNLEIKIGEFLNPPTQNTEENTRASRLVKSYPITADNYPKVIAALKDRFGDRVILTEVYVRQLLGLVVNNARRKTKKIEDLYDKLESYLRSLESLGITTEQNAAFLYPLVESSLPKELITVWQRSSLSGYNDEGEDTPQPVDGRLGLLLKFLRREVKGEERLAYVRAGFGESSNSKSTRPNTTRLHVAEVKKPRKRNLMACLFCRGDHWLRSCQKWLAMSVQKRREVLMRHRACFKCLRVGHHGRQCWRYVECKICKKSHNTLLHLGEQLVSGQRSSSGLGIPVSKVDAQIYGINATKGEEVKDLAHFAIRPLGNQDWELPLQALVVNKMTGLLPSRDLRLPMTEKLRDIQLAEPQFMKSGRIDIILGADVYGLLLLPEIRRDDKTQLCAQNTKLGWIISGGLSGSEVGNTQVFTTRVQYEDNLETILKRFWEVEEVRVATKITPQDEFCEDLYKSSVRRDTNGRYIVPLPFDPRVGMQDFFGNSLDLCVRQQMALERRLALNDQLGKDYYKFMEDYEGLGHMTQLTEIPVGDQVGHCYLPHHAVIGGQPNRGKFRVILVRPSDAERQRIIWRRRSEDKLMAYRLNTVTYGTAAAPFLAMRTLLKLVEDEGAKYPRASRAIIKDTYVDDIITGADDLRDGMALRDELIEVLRCGGFTLKKWSSNDLTILGNIAKEHCAQKITFEQSKVIRTLGLGWIQNEDCFLYDVQSLEKTSVTTKREMLSFIAKLYDPLGWLAPVLVTGKIMVQRLWITGLHWDDPMDESLIETWTNFRKELNFIGSLRIPRWLGLGRNTQGVQLHGFGDSSEDAYAAAVYIRIPTDDGVSVKLLASKSKLAPIRKMSIPRLELCAALLLTRLMRYIMEELNIKMESATCWSDSTIVLSWIRTMSRNLPTFIGNRVAVIQSCPQIREWRYVPTGDNPADIASRGILGSELKQSSIWWTGPTWLSAESTEWPRIPPVFENQGQIELLSVHALSETPFLVAIGEMSSTFNGYIRKVAWILRFCHNCRYSAERYQSHLTTAELRNAHRRILQAIQYQHFREEIRSLNTLGSVKRTSKIYGLTPFLDDQGILRVGGRLKWAPSMTYEQKHPALLPSSGKVAQMIVQAVHMRTLHGSVHLMLSTLRQKYWMLRAKDQVKRCIRECVTCCRYNRVTQGQLMSDLPKERLTPGKPFSISGVDYAGPVNLRMSKGRGRKTEKGYICLFVCFVTRAVHLELVTDASTLTFMSAFKRFVARRGHCTRLYSDQGTNFVGAARQLRSCFYLAQNQLKELAAVWKSEKKKTSQKKIGEHDVIKISKSESKGDGVKDSEAEFKGEEVKDSEAEPKGEGVKDSEAEPKGEGLDSEAEPKGDGVKDSEIAHKGNESVNNSEAKTKTNKVEDTVEEAQVLIRQIIALLAEGGFPIKKWVSNSPKILDFLPKDQKGINQSFDFKYLPSVKLLGILWDPSLDSFTIRVKPPDIQVYSKRSLLSLIARIYDPLGWMAPLVVIFKIMLQKLWAKGCNWDERLPECIQWQWTGIEEDINQLNKISIPRYIPCRNSIRTLELHGFCDSSEKSYAAVIYVKSYFVKKLLLFGSYLYIIMGLENALRGIGGDEAPQVYGTPGSGRLPLEFSSCLNVTYRGNDFGGSPILIIVNSAPAHYRARMAIRRSWGSAATAANLPVVFFLGATTDHVMEWSLQLEAERYGDLARSSCIDNYRNLTLKTVALLKLAIRLCSDIQSIMKCDDDVFLNVPQLLKWLPEAPSDAIVGRVAQGWAPLRDKASRYYVSEEEFASS
ncbi:hypothetical protein LAZ67_1007130, partial [Cordylochernes scorpioides]